MAKYGKNEALCNMGKMKCCVSWQKLVMNFVTNLVQNFAI